MFDFAVSYLKKSPTGFEPATLRSRGGCSNQAELRRQCVVIRMRWDETLLYRLSYGTLGSGRIRTCDQRLRRLIEIIAARILRS